MAQHPHDVGVRDHRPLRRARGATRVDDRRQVKRADLEGPLADDLWMTAQAVGAGALQGIEAEHERVTGASGPVDENHPLQRRQPVPHLHDLAQLGVRVHKADRHLGVAEDVGDLRR